VDDSELGVRGGETETGENKEQHQIAHRGYGTLAAT
jgi:hypothetical protein